MTKTTTDKIRILWIDDKDTPYPERVLPREYAPFFIIESEHESPEGFGQAVQDMLTTTRSLAAAEIVAMDYNLTKASISAVGEGTLEAPDRKTLVVRKSSASSAGDLRPSESPKNFHGLVMGLFYGLLASKHPVAIVPITQYDYDRFPEEAKLLHALGGPFLRVDFGLHEKLNAANRSWQNILRKGAPLLQKRIQELYASGAIIIEPDGLMSLAETGAFPTLTLHTPLGSRTLPVQGLFVDLWDRPSCDRQSAIREWASLTARHVIGTKEYSRAYAIANKVWSTYSVSDESSLVDRMKISKHFAGIETCPNIEALRQRFAVPQEGKTLKCQSSDCIDWNAPSGDDANSISEKQSMRWAVLLLVFRLLEQAIMCRHAHLPYPEQRRRLPTMPDLGEYDFWFALFPLPSSPMVLPWHVNGARKAFANALSTWKAQLKTLGLDLSSVLEGSSDGTGLTGGERQFLQGLALQSFPKEEWESYATAHRVLGPFEVAG